MNISGANFQRLKEEFCLKTTAPKALRIMRKRGADKKYMRRLLRHHEETSITNRETWKRDYFDNLLFYYSMLELSLLTRFVEKIPEEDRSEVIEVLSHPAVRVYYREHYPLLLPQLLLERLVGKNLTVISETQGKIIDVFLQYVPLAYSAETDDDIENFLWFLDGGRRAGYDYRDTLRTLRSQKRLLKSILKKPSRKTALDASVEGFGKFLNFCVQLDSTLQRCSRWPAFQQEVYENHAYWFRQMGDKLGDKVFRALDNYVEAEDKAWSEDNYFVRAGMCLKRLLSEQHRFGSERFNERRKVTRVPDLKA